jgi:hypothetical protein
MHSKVGLLGTAGRSWELGWPDDIQAVPFRLSPHRGSDYETTSKLSCLVENFGGLPALQQERHARTEGKHNCEEEQHSHLFLTLL